MLLPIGGDFIVDIPAATNDYLYYDVPAADCVGWYWLGGSLSRSVKNGVKGGRQALLVGNPIVNRFWLGLQGRNNFLNTTYLESVAMTYMCIARSTDTNAANANRPTFIGSSADDDEVSNIHVSADSTVRIGVGMLDSDGIPTTPFPASSVAPPGSDANNWGCYIAKFDGDSRLIKNMTSGITSTTGSHSGTRALAELPICIGGDVGSLRQGSCDVMQAAFWYRETTDAEDDLLYEKVKRYCDEVNEVLVAAGEAGIVI